MAKKTQKTQETFGEEFFYRNTVSDEDIFENILEDEKLDYDAKCRKMISVKRTKKEYYYKKYGDKSVDEVMSDYKASAIKVLDLEHFDENATTKPEVTNLLKELLADEDMPFEKKKTILTRFKESYPDIFNQFIPEYPKDTRFIDFAWLYANLGIKMTDQIREKLMSQFGLGSHSSSVGTKKR